MNGLEIFKPCPICGRPLNEKCLVFSDDDGLGVGLDYVTDYEHISDPKNAMYAEDWENADQNRRENAEFAYNAYLSHVTEISLKCYCGFRYSTSERDVGFPKDGWLENFALNANKRTRSDAP